MECRYCGQRLKDGYEYCPNCGGRVEPPEQQARPVQPAYAPQGAYSAPVQRYSPAGSGGLCLRHAPTRRRAGPGRFALLRTGICRHRCGRKRPFQCGGILSGAVPSALPRLLQTVCTHISALLAGAAVRAGREPFLFWKAVCGAGRLRRPGRSSRRRRFSCGSPRSCCCPWA